MVAHILKGTPDDIIVTASSPGYSVATVLLHVLTLQITNWPRENVWTVTVIR